MTPVPVLALVAALALPAAAAAQARDEAKEFYHATAVSTTGVAPPLFELEITVDRYSTAGEGETLQTAFRKRGQEGLLAAIQEGPRVGSFRVPGNLAYDIRYAVHFMGRDNRRRIILISDRPVGFLEASERPRSVDYPFLVIDLRVDASGIGEGQVMYPAAVGFERHNEIMIEELLDQPIRLTKVRQQKK